MNLLELIPKGRENAVTRERLMLLTGWSDRRIRKEIERLRTAGNPIVGFSSAKGYWISSDIDEIDRFCREYDHRNDTGRRTTERLRRMVIHARGYGMVVVRQHLRRLHKIDELEGQTKL